MAFDAIYNLAARPFDWKYTKKDLDALLARIATHKPDAAMPASALPPTN